MHVVIAQPAIQRIGPVPAEQAVIIVAAKQAVIAEPTIQAVIARITAQRIQTIAARNGIVTKPALDGIVIRWRRLKMHIRHIDELVADPRVVIVNLHPRQRPRDVDQNGPQSLGRRVVRVPAACDRVAHHSVIARRRQRHGNRVAIGVIGTDCDQILPGACVRINIVDPETDVRHRIAELFARHTRKIEGRG